MKWKQKPQKSRLHPISRTRGTGKKRGLASVEELRDLLWQDVPEDLRFRRHVWNGAMKRLRSMKIIEDVEHLPQIETFSRYDLSSAQLFALNLYTEQEGRCARFLSFNPNSENVERPDKSVTQPELVSVRHMLGQFLFVHKVEELPAGSAEIAALSLNVMGAISQSFELFCSLMNAVKVYSDDQSRRFRTEILVLADVISHRLPMLRDHFNTIGFDVVDLGDLASAWVRDFGSGLFPVPFVLRVVDVVLVEGPSVLIAIMYGIMAHFEDKLLLSDDSAGFYEKIEKIPSSLMNDQAIANVLRSAFSIFAQSELSSEADDSNPIALLANNKSWDDIIASGDPLNFHSGVGDSKSVQRLLNMSQSALLGGPSDTQVGAPGVRVTLDESKKAEEALFERDSKPVWMTETSMMLASAEKDDPGYLNIVSQKKRLEEELETQNATINSLKSELSSRSGFPDDDFRRPMSGTMRTNYTDRSGDSIESLDDIMDDQRSFHKRTGSVRLRANIVNNVLLSTAHADSSAKENSIRYSNFASIYSEAMESLECPCLFMEGWLFKMGRTGSIFSRPQLHRRWFVLKGQFFTYFKSHLHAKPQKDKCLDLRKAIIRPMAGHSKGKFAIEIIVSSSPGERRRLSSYGSESADQPAQPTGGTSGTSVTDTTELFEVTDDHDTLMKKVATLRPRTSNSTASEDGERFVLFATCVEERNKWIVAMQCASQGPLFEQDDLARLECKSGPGQPDG
eukprot:205393_1